MTSFCSDEEQKQGQGPASQSVGNQIKKYDYGCVLFTQVSLFVVIVSFLKCQNN